MSYIVKEHGSIKHKAGNHPELNHHDTLVIDEVKNDEDGVNAEGNDPVPPILAVKLFDIDNFFCLFLLNFIVLDRSEIISLLFLRSNIENSTLNVTLYQMVNTHENHKDLICIRAIVRASLLE